MPNANHLVSNNKSKIFQLFLHKKHEIIINIAWLRIVQRLKDVSCDLNQHGLEMATHKCWACYEKEQLLKETFEEFREDSEVGAESSETLGNSLELLTEKSYKELFEWFHEERRKKSPRCFPFPDFIRRSKLDPSIETFWVDLLKEIKNSLDAYGDDVARNIVSNSHDDPGYTRFPVSTHLTLQQLSRQFPLSFLRNSSTEDNRVTVSVEICSKCLKEISLFVLRSNSGGGSKVACVSGAIEQVASSAVDNQSTCSAPETKNNASFSRNRTPPSASLKRIQITLVRRRKQEKGQNQLKPVITSGKAIAASQSAESDYNLEIDHPLQPSAINTFPFPQSRTSPAPMTLRNSDFSLGSQTALMPSNPVFTRLKPIRLTRKKLCVPLLSKPFFNNHASKNIAKSISKLKFTTAPPCGAEQQPANRTRSSPTLKTFSEAPVKFVLAKPLTTISTNSPLPNGRVLRVFPQIGCVNGKLFPLSRAGSIPDDVSPSKVTVVPTATNQVPQNNNNLSKEQKTVKRKKQTNKAESGGAERKKAKLEDSEKAANQTTSGNSTEPKNGAQKSHSAMKPVKPSGDVKTKPQSMDGKQRTSAKPPVKRKVADKVPMKFIVRDFLAQTAGKSSNEPHPSNHNPAKRASRHKRSRVLKKLIPIPYEAHYLCNYETIAKKGWKAYWYQKCRCARPRKKTPSKTIRRSPRKPNKVSSMSCNQQREGSLNSNVKKVPTKSPGKERSKPDSVRCKLEVKNVGHFNSNSSNSAASPQERNEELDAIVLPSSIPVADQPGTSVRKSFELQVLTRRQAEQALVQLNTALADSVPREERCADDKKAPNNLVVSSGKNPKAKCAQTVLPKHKVAPSKAATVKTERRTTSPSTTKTALCQTGRDDLESRKKRVDAVANCVLKRSAALSQSDVDTLPGKLLRSHLFEQCFEEVDKQPGSADLVSVSPAILVDYPVLFEKAKETEERRLAEKPELMSVSQARPQPSERATSLDDLDSIWCFGKLPSSFTERTAFSAKLKHTKAQFRKRTGTLRVTDRTRAALGRALGSFTSNRPTAKIYRHHSRRPKADCPNESKDKSDDNDLCIPIEPYSDPWRVPKTSTSLVVGALESFWADDDSGYIGLTDAVCGIADESLLTRDLVERALSALRNSNDIFTFSSKPKEGKNTVLLIKRKLVEKQLQDEVCGKNGLSTTLSAPSGLDEKPSPCDSNKILLKLRKTGEVSGSPIYSVPKGVSSSGPLVEVGPDQLKASGGESISSTIPSSFPPPPTTSGAASCDDGARNLFSAMSSTSPHPTDVNRMQATTHLPSSLNFVEVPTEKWWKMSSPDVDFSDNPDADCNDNPDVDYNANPEADYKDKLDVSCNDNPDVNCNDNPDVNCNDNSDVNCNDNPDVNCTGNPDVDFNDNPDVDCNIASLRENLHSTMLENSESDLWFLSRDSPLFNYRDSTSFFGSDDFMCLRNIDEFDKMKIDWNGTVDGKDELEELLLSVDEKSFETLERLLVFGDNSDISPSRLLRLINNGTDNRSPATSRHHQDATGASPIYNRCQSFFSNFDSPELIRGNSNSKDSDQNSCSVIPPLFSEGDDEVLRSTPLSSPKGASTPQENEGHKATSVLKNCNVLLKPLEGMLQDLKRNDSSRDRKSSSAQTSGQRSELPFSESSVRELNRLLKNRALNGAYWKSTDVESDLMESSSTSGRWRFRDRRKRKSCDVSNAETDTSFDNSMVESEEEAEEEVEEVIIYPKRKNRNLEKHSRPSHADLFEVLSKIQAMNQPVGAERSSNGELADNRPLSSLLANGIDLDRVRKWFLAASLSHPLPYRFPLLLARKAVASRKPSKASVHDDVTFLTSSSEHEKPVPKKMPKKDCNRNITKSYETEEFQALRLQLFRLRHPNYNGEICGIVESPTPLDPSYLPVRPNLKLHRVDASEAQKIDSPTLPSSLLIRSPPLKKSVTLSDDDDDVPLSYACNAARSSPRNVPGCYANQEKTEQEAISTSACHSVPLSPPCNAQSIPGLVSVSSRGRTIKPSLRNRSICYFDPPPEKKRRLVAPVKPPAPTLLAPTLPAPTLPAPALPPAKVATTYTFARGRGRFAEKHSTSGAYIQKVLDSGVYGS